MKEARRYGFSFHFDSDSKQLELSMIQYEYAASVWAVIERFGGLLITDELNGADIRRLENIITMDVNLHTKFDRLAILLEADSVRHLIMFKGNDLHDVQLTR